MLHLFFIASFPFGVWGAVLPFIFIFLAMDVLLATPACILEREPMRRLRIGWNVWGTDVQGVPVATEQLHVLRRFEISQERLPRTRREW